MSYENAVGGKLKLNGKALNVQLGGAKKKLKKDKSHLKQLSIVTDEDAHADAGGDDGGGTEIALQEPKMGEHGGNEDGHAPLAEDHCTAAEKRYHEQKLKLDTQRLAKTSSKSHRERIEDFNEYLANLGEHYDIPKVGPG